MIIIKRQQPFSIVGKMVYEDVLLVVTLLINPAILIFYNFPSSIRKTIYSTKLIEIFNKK